MIYYLDLNGLTYYDTKIKNYIEEHIPDAAEALVNAYSESGEQEFFKIAICSQEDYDNLGDNWEEGTLYIISDDSTLTELNTLITRIKVRVDGVDYTQNSSGVVTLPDYPTRSSLQIDSVVNTGDSDTPLQGGTAKFTTGGAYTLQQAINTVDGRVSTESERASGAEQSLTEQKVNSIQYETVTVSEQTDKAITQTKNGSTTNIVTNSTLKSDLGINGIDSRVQALEAIPYETQIWTFLVKDTETGEERPLNIKVYVDPTPIESGKSGE